MAIIAQKLQRPLNGDAGYVLLSMNGLKLLIPQDQVVALELSTDIVVNQSGNVNVGNILFKDRSWPIFCFDHKLDLLTSIASDRRFCILLKTAEYEFAILSETALLINSALYLQSLPEVSLTTDSPIQALTLYKEDVACISSAEHLSRLLTLTK